MSRTKERKKTRDRFGSVLVRKIQRDGRTVTVYDARKRYTRADGTRGEKFQRCDSDTEARIALINFNNEIQREGIEADAPPPKHTFHELVAYFDKEYVRKPVFAHGVKISGYRQNLQQLRTILDEQKQFFGDRPLDAITYEDVRSYHAFVSTRKIVTGTGKAKKSRLPALSTVNERLSVLRRIFNIGIQLAWLDVSPFKRGPGLIRRSQEKRRNRMLTFDEEVRLLDACTGRRRHLRAWIIATLDTAMRRGDLYNLRWKDIDLDNRVIYIERRDKGEHELRSKTGVAGIVPVTDRLYDELRKLRAWRRGLRPTHLVFGHHDIKRAFRTACDTAEIPDLQFRDLRSTASTRMLLAGNANALVRKITRHTEDDILIEHYTNIDIENARIVGRKLEEFVDFGLSKVNAKGKAPEVQEIEQTANY